MSRDHRVQIHFVYDLAIDQRFPVYVAICGRRYVEPAAVTTDESGVSCKGCKRCLEKRKKREPDP